MWYTHLMTDDPKEPADETPMQRALRLKKAAESARNRPGGKLAPSKSIAAGASRPWMKK